MLKLSRSVAAIVVALAWCQPASAQQLGYSNVLSLPIVADTASYQSVIYVHNPGTSASLINFNYRGATTSATPGFRPCSQQTVTAGTVVKTSLGTLCGLNPGSNFGALEAMSGNQFTIYSRVQTPSGNGFSIEGLSENDCCFQVREVIGLTRQASPPAFQSNCFLSNHSVTAGRVVITLATQSGALIANRIIDLQPSEFVRLLDIFAAVDAPAGDYDNVRASFESIAATGGGGPISIVASCTVQNNTSFDADFRVAKPHS